MQAIRVPAGRECRLRARLSLGVQFNRKREQLDLVVVERQKPLRVQGVGERGRAWAVVWVVVVVLAASIMEPSEPPDDVAVSARASVDELKTGGGDRPP